MVDTMTCPSCQIQIKDSGKLFCPKCGHQFFSTLRDELHCIDIAHDGEDWFDAEQKLLAGIDFALKNRFKGLKVIHGSGAEHGHTDTIKKKTIPYLNRMAQIHGGKVVQDKHTDGAHILYFN